MSTRLAALRALLRERDLPALLVSDAANRRYISGFSGSHGALLVSAEAALAFTDSRYRIQIGEEAPHFALREIRTEQPLLNLVAEATIELGFDRLAFEAAAVSYATYGELVAALAAAAGEDYPIPSLVATQGLVEQLREVKDAAELAIMRKAIAITDQAFAAVLPSLRPDMSERQAAWMLEVAMRERGAEGLAFPIIVAAGPNSARPHAHPTDEPLGLTRPIVIDMGARVDGYHADLTRTVILGEPDARFREIYTIVIIAQQRAIHGLRAGLSGQQADALARDHIVASGYGDQFGHGLGHGVGLNIHESPSLRRAAPGKEGQAPVLRAGNVTSVEPGIYLEDWGGVRIEDLVLITEEGCEVLSRVAK